MSTLILYLPVAPTGPATRYDYAATPDGRILATYASAALALLPALAKTSDVVAVVPASALSWHAVDLPKGVGSNSPRLRLVLENLLEDRLLDDPNNLHLALAPSSNTTGSVWVAVCNKAWLRGHVQALENAQCRVTRIVPEFAPDSGSLYLHVVGDADSPQLLVTGAAIGGVLRLPLSVGAAALVPTNPADQPGSLQLFAEPAVAELAEQLLGQNAVILTRPERWLNAARSPWDLAQFDMANSSGARTIKKLSGIAKDLLRTPNLRPARWGIVTLLGVQLLGLNAWAWKEKSTLQALRTATQNTLVRTFPHIKLVVDAPVQMAREVAALRRATGAASGNDLEALLGALAIAAPTAYTASAIDFSAGQVRLKGSQLSAPETAQLQAQLSTQGYAIHQEAGALILKQQASLGGQQGIAP